MEGDVPMAVDIYGFAEMLTGGMWTLVGDMVPNPERRWNPDEPELMPELFFHSIHKELAAILVDTGFPIRSSEPYAPVVAKRGLPKDLSPELAAWFGRDPSEPPLDANWFTAGEARAFGWSERIMRRRAYVPVEAAPLFRGCPRGFPIEK